MKKLICFSLLALSVTQAYAAAPASLEKARALEAEASDKNVSVTKDNFAFVMLDLAMNEEVKHGATNKFYHHRMPMEIDKQPAVLMNRDTLYSFAIIDASHGATVTLPEGDGRYFSLHVMDHDHITENVFYGAGDYKIDPQKSTRFVVLNVRTQVNPNDPADIAKAHKIQDEYRVTFPQGYTPEAFKVTDWNKAELKTLQEHYRSVADKRGVSKTMGPRDAYPQEDVNVGAGVATGLLPDKDAWYSFNNYKVSKALCYTATYSVPGMTKPDLGFYSMTIYGEDLYLHTEKGSSLSNKELKLNPDGKSFTLHYGTPETCGKDAPNLLIAPSDNWTLALRVYFPAQDIQDNTYKLPQPVPVNK
ncbi:DUF1254 domain-containing protein [Erwinia sp.]|uniref:DUF1254 domain-containing protein n=1 Tax=Erwinia citreus TaxID=558 RepID=UPI003C76FB33